MTGSAGASPVIILVDPAFSRREPRGLCIRDAAGVNRIPIVHKFELVEGCLPDGTMGIIGHGPDLGAVRVADRPDLKAQAVAKATAMSWLRAGGLKVVHYAGSAFELPPGADKELEVCFPRRIDRDGAEAPTPDELRQIWDWFLGKTGVPAFLRPADDLLARLTPLGTLCFGYLLARGEPAEIPALVSSRPGGRALVDAARGCAELTGRPVARPGELPGWFDPAMPALADAPDPTAADPGYWRGLIETGRAAGPGWPTADTPPRWMDLLGRLARSADRSRLPHETAVRAVAGLCRAVFDQAGVRHELTDDLTGPVRVEPHDWPELVYRAHLGYQLLRLVHL